MVTPEGVVHGFCSLSHHLLEYSLHTIALNVRVRVSSFRILDVKISLLAR